MLLDICRGRGGGRVGGAGAMPPSQNLFECFNMCNFRAVPVKYLTISPLVLPNKNSSYAYVRIVVSFPNELPRRRNLL